MWFKNLTCLRLPPSVTLLPSLHETLAESPLREPGPLELETRGFISPWHNGDHLVALSSKGVLQLSLGQITRDLPASVLRDAINDRVAEHEIKTGRKPGKRLRNEFREAALGELLPRAFFIRRRIDALWLPAHCLWLVDTSADRAAELITSAVREAIGSFPARPLASEASLSLLMSEWLISGQLPKGFELGDVVELKDPSDTASVVRAKNHDLTGEEIREHARRGHQVTKLGLIYDQRISFVLDSKLKLRNLSFLDILADKLDVNDGADPNQIFEAELFLQAEELTKLFTALDSVLRFVD